VAVAGVSSEKDFDFCSQCCSIQILDLKDTKRKIQDHIMKFSLISLFLYLVSSVALAQDAAFGLKWGMSKELVEKTGVALTRTGGEGNLEIFRTTSVPIPVSIGESYTLTFHQSWGLQKIIMRSKKIQNDPTGREGKEQYNNL